MSFLLFLCATHMFRISGLTRFAKTYNTWRSPFRLRQAAQLVLSCTVTLGRRSQYGLVQGRGTFVLFSLVSSCEEFFRTRSKNQAVQDAHPFSEYNE
ncbi:hypothetical protein AVEN_36256-1 [Araneus ventricosus]|uniref:Secreted protein n=1 Tax=Araneus ventricosus TaxID=182803 RepID=A0A4Y2KCH4_ARAVE|nr:hypothetical protein AVEN_36256-1 [Araneus ventricosus]